MNETGLRQGLVLKRRGSSETAVVCQVRTFTVLLEALNTDAGYFTIPLSAVWKTFERTEP